MGRRTFSLDYKLEAIKLVRDRGVSVAQASRDLGVHENVLRKWVKDWEADKKDALPGHGQIKTEQQELERLRREVAKLKAERDILKKSHGLLREQRRRIQASTARRQRGARNHLAQPGPRFRQRLAPL